MKKVLSLVLSLTLVFGMFAFVGAEPSYAAVRRPAKVKNLSIKKYSEDSVKITWKKAKRAKKYQIYRKIEGEKTFRCVLITRSKGCIAKQTAGRKYSYKIRAERGKRLGKFSAVKSMTLPIVVKKSITPSVTSLSFDVQTTKTISFTCTDIQNLDYAISPVAEVVEFQQTMA